MRILRHLLIFAILLGFVQTVQALTISPQLKEKLIHQMAEFILENKLVEFTHWDDPITFDRHIAVRAYLAPDNQVRIIRSVIKV